GAQEAPHERVALSRNLSANPVDVGVVATHLNRNLVAADVDDAAAGAAAIRERRRGGARHRRGEPDQSDGGHSKRESVALLDHDFPFPLFVITAGWSSAANSHVVLDPDITRGGHDLATYTQQCREISFGHSNKVFQLTFSRLYPAHMHRSNAMHIYLR